MFQKNRIISSKNRVDIFAEVDGKEKINFEIQNKNEYNIKERSEAYGSGLYYTHYIQLPKFLKQVEEIKTKEEQWLAYISGSLKKEELEELYKMTKEQISELLDIKIEEIERILLKDNEIA